jgi:glycosyltransferase involved in cell wall biosynthesis
MVDLWLQGYDVLNAVRSSRDSDTWVKRTTARLFYRFINTVADVPIPRDVGDYRLLSRRVCDALRTMRETHRFMKGLFAWVGFPTASVEYKRPPRSAGQSKWNYWRLWNFALEGIISFSTAPLKLASYLGLATASYSLLFACYLIIRTLIYGDPVRGYPSTMAVILFLGGIQLLFIGIIGEYIARIHEETKGRPIYIVESTQGIEATGGIETKDRKGQNSITD